MKIAICSDLHLEIGSISLENTEGADVLILGGDICLAVDVLERDTFSHDNRSHELHQFFQECCDRFKHVIYIAGNHEHYNGDFVKSIPRLREHLGYLNNLYILDKQVMKIDGVTFIGGTLWTDMNKEDPHTMYSIRSYMNDFRIIQNSGVDVHFKDQEGNRHVRTGRLTPDDVVEDHKKMLQFIDECTKESNAKYVVVGHHAPSKLSVKPRYERDVIVNGAYSSDLSEFILDRPQIKLWTHGHTHDEFEYVIGETKVVCNPRGYVGYEVREGDFKLKFVEV